MELDAITGRYDSDALATVYRRQQECLSLGNVRLGLLARRELATMRKQLVSAGARSRVLDMPAGTGKLWPLFRSLGIECVAGDLSINMLRQGPETHGVARVAMDGRSIPFPDGSFDGVASLRLFHRLPHDVRLQVLGEFSRVGARWIAVSYAVNSGLFRIRYAVRSWLSGSKVWAPYPASPRLIRKELEVAGYELVSIRPVAWLLSNEVIALGRRRVQQALRPDAPPDSPCCKASLVEASGGLSCAQCGEEYARVDGIPVLLPSDTRGDR